MRHTKTIPKMSLELMFVLNCTNFPKIDNEQLINFLAFDLDWDLVLHMAMVHRIFPLVYKTINNLDNSTVPEYVIHTLQQEYKKNALMAVNLTGETIRINKMMEENGIQPLVLKGAPLAQELYEDITLRPSNDIDILVDPQEFVIAQKALEHLKYKRYSPDSRQEKLYLKKFKHFSYIHSVMAVSVELHWRAINPDITDYPDLSSLRTQKIDIWGHQVYTMADEEWLIYLIIHGSNHMWLRLRWLVDVKIFLKKDLNWNKIISLADSYNLKLMLHTTIILLNELFEIPIPDSLTQSLAKDQKAWKIAYMVMNRLSYSKNEIEKYRLLYLKSLIQVNNYHLSLRMGWKRKLSYIIRKLHPHVLDIQLVSFPNSLNWLYYFIKPFYWIKRHFFIKDDR